MHIIFCYVSIRYDSTEEPAINFKDNLMLNELQSKGDLAGFLGLTLEKLDFFVYPTSMMTYIEIGWFQKETVAIENY